MVKCNHDKCGRDYPHLHASALEAIRYWKADEEATTDDLRRKLLGEEPPNERMKAGHAFAKLLEFARDGEELDVHDIEGFRFEFDIVASLPLSPHREVSAQREVETPYGPIVLVGHADVYGGTIIRDAKLTEKIDVERYFDSLQWRTYLWLFGAKEFVYDLFLARYDGRHVVISDYLPFGCMTYPKIEQDVSQAVSEAAGIIRRYVPEMVT